MKSACAPFIGLLIAGFASAAPGPGNDREVLLDVQPAAAPVPALKYQLLPEVSELNPGNAVPAYLKCFAEQNSFFFSKEAVAERERLLKCPLTDIKPGSLKEYGRIALRQADHAARLEYADWNILPQMREQGYWLLIPEVQEMRMLAANLLVRGRGQLVDRDFEGATSTLKTLFAMARHMGEHPTVISGLVGIAIAQFGCNLIEEFVQQPGAPNLYWALTFMPSPVVDIRKGASADRVITEFGFGPLLDKTRIWTAEDMPGVMQKLKEFAGILELSAADRTLGEAWLKERVQDAVWLKAARKGLTDAGCPAEAVAKYPPEQVVLHHMMRKARIYTDEGLKWMLVPYWQAEAGLAEFAQPAADIEEKMARQIVFAVPRVKAAHARLEQRLAMLRVVEAVRMEAVKSGGKLPESLTGLSVPVPIDEVSGKAFEYKVNGLTATIAGKRTPITGGGQMQYRYEIRLRK
jgi:hypothetical protein